MIDPDCKVCLSIGWVCENHPQRAWTDELGCQCGQECPVNVFALTASMLDTEKNLEVTLLYWMRTG